MAIKKTVDASLIGNLVAGTANQQVSGGSQKSDDPNFPVFRTPLEKDIIVYLPKVCVTEVDGKEVYNPLVSHAHSVKKGAKGFATYRCISGLAGDVYDALGYDGTCPFCEGLAVCWELYNEKMARKAIEVGVDLQNDTADIMKPHRQQFVQEMAIKKAEEYVTFPIVIISETGTIPATPDAAKYEAQYVTMRKDTFVKKIMEPLTKQAVPVENPAGYFYKWCFTYDTKGKPANVRDAAKEAQYMPIMDAASVNALSVFIPKAEEAAAGFTNTQAATCVIINQFYEKAEIAKEADAILAETNRTLAVLKSGAAAPAQAALPNNIGPNVAGALAAFVEPAATAAPAPAATPAPTVTTAPAATNAPNGQFPGFGA